MDAHNALYDAGKVGWRMGINEDFDWTNQEQDEWHGGVFLDSGNTKEREINDDDEVERPTQRDVPDSWSWVEQGGVNQIKNQVQSMLIFYKIVIAIEIQGPCGSCVAFATNAALETCSYLKTGDLVPFSEQLPLSCNS